MVKIKGYAEHLLEKIKALCLVVDLAPSKIFTDQGARAEFVRYVFNYHEVSSHRYIHAIKAVRDCLQLSLQESKEFVDWSTSRTFIMDRSDLVDLVYGETAGMESVDIGDLAALLTNRQETRIQKVVDMGDLKMRVREVLATGENFIA